VPEDGGDGGEAVVCCTAAASRNKASFKLISSIEVLSPPPPEGVMQCCRRHQNLKYHTRLLLVASRVPRSHPLSRALRHFLCKEKCRKASSLPLPWERLRHVRCDEPLQRRPSSCGGKSSALTWKVVVSTSSSSFLSQEACGVSNKSCNHYI
jgi:DNA polymerase III psi subunit